MIQVSDVDCMLSNYPVRKSTRLKFYDYSQCGAYFVTICTQNRERLFGDIVEEKMVLNTNGQIVVESWQWFESQYDHITLDEWVVMPDHFHGILWLNEPTNLQQKPLGRLIGAFKTVSSKKIHSQNFTLSRIWQRYFHDRIIRNDNELEQIRHYIQTNPQNWKSP